MVGIGWWVVGAAWWCAVCGVMVWCGGVWWCGDVRCAMCGGVAVWLCVVWWSGNMWCGVCVMCGVVFVVSAGKEQSEGWL